jgi:hypothetical protein
MTHAARAPGVMRGTLRTKLALLVLSGDHPPGDAD